MSIWERLKRLFKRLNQPEQALKALKAESEEKIPYFEEKEQKFENRLGALKAEDQALKALKAPLKALKAENFEIKEEKPEKIELEKESISLGLAAGYFGKSLREIENSLTRIETFMVNKEWFSNQFNQGIKKLEDLIISHDQKTQELLDKINQRLDELSGIASKAPSPIREELVEKIEKIKKEASLTPRMKEILQLVKLRGEVSYEDLAKELGISISALRSILTTMALRTNEIERFVKNGKGWVRYRGA